MIMSGLLCRIKERKGKLYKRTPMRIKSLFVISKTDIRPTDLSSFPFLSFIRHKRPLMIVNM